jgi:ABC-type multidrug transport system fused ATPase/permease subunit
MFKHASIYSILDLTCGVCSIQGAKKVAWTVILMLTNIITEVLVLTSIRPILGNTIGSIDLASKSDYDINYLDFLILVALIAAAAASRLFILRDAYVGPAAICEKVTEEELRIYKSKFMMEHDSVDINLQLANLTINKERFYSVIHYIYLGWYSFLVVITISLAVLILAPSITIIVAVPILLLYLSLSISVKPRLNRYAKTQSDAAYNLSRLAADYVHGIYELIQAQADNLFERRLIQEERSLRVSIAMSKFTGSFPKYLVESIGLTAVLVYSLYCSIANVSPINFISSLGIVAIGIQRILPNSQVLYGCLVEIYSSLESISSYKKILVSRKHEIRIHLTNKLSKHVANNDFRTIRLENIFLSRSNSKIIDNISIILNKGEKVSIVGESGSGKSSLINVIAGLLPPTSGRVLIDGIDLYSSDNKEFRDEWISSASHIRQKPYIFNGSMVYNIIFGLKNNKVPVATINALGLRSIFNTSTRYNAKQLSGGEAARLAFCRTMTATHNLVILDEATAALDLNNERKYLDEVIAQHKCALVISVAHKPSAIIDSTRIIRLTDGAVEFDIQSSQDIKEYLQKYHMAH